MPMNPDGIAVKGLGTAGIPDTTEVVTVQGTGAGGALSVFDRPYDRQQYLLVTGATAASLVFPATVGKRWVVGVITAATANAGGAVKINAATLTDGATVIWGDVLVLNAVYGDTKNIFLSDLRYVGTANTAMTLAFLDVPGLNNYQSVAMGAWLI